MPETKRQEVMTDPAARLISLLSRCSAVKPNQSYLYMWRQVFELDELDVVEIYHRLDLLREMTSDVERGILQIPDIKHDVYLKPLLPVRQFISRANLQEGWDPNRPVLEMALSSLEFCSERLQAFNPETLIEKRELDDIRKQVDDLISRLELSVSLPRKLRLVLFDLLKAIRRSIDEYIFKGTRGLRKELFLIIGSLQENLEAVSANKDKEEVKSFFKVIEKIDIFTAAALKVKELAGGFAPYVPLLMQAVETISKQ